MPQGNTKNDLSDIVGILYEEKTKGNRISRKEIQQAYTDMYKTVTFPETSKAVLDWVFETPDYQQLYNNIRTDEIRNRKLISCIDHTHPELLKEAGPSRIIEDHKHKNPK